MSDEIRNKRFHYVGAQPLTIYMPEHDPHYFACQAFWAPPDFSASASFTIDDYRLAPLMNK